MYTAPRERSKKGLFAVVVIFLAIALVVNGWFLLSLQRNLKSEIEALKTDLTQKQQENDSLKTENEKLKTDVKEYKTRIDRLNGVAVPPPPDKTVYLTFDDGPSVHTVPILEVLKKYNVKATFFVTGRASDKDKALYKRIVDEGHVIANHTYSHNYGKIYQSVDAFMEDVYKLDKVIYDATGVKTKVVRFPGGTSNTLTNPARIRSITKRLLSEGYQYFDWNVDSYDGTMHPPLADEMVSKIMHQVKWAKNNTSIVLMHDLGSKVSTLEALPKLIETLSAKGYKFGVLNVNSYYVHHR